LVVEDEEPLALLLRYNLEAEGYSVDVVHRGDEAEMAIAESSPDLIVLDWMLPGQSGLALARRWSESQRTRELPIIMLTARTQEADKIAGLDAGADDYLVKPFSTQELLARIRALLRRRAPETLGATVTIDALSVDPSIRRVTAQGRELRLGPTEFRLLHYLMTHAERVHSRKHLLDRVWGDHVFIEERTVDVHVKRLRDALAPAQRESMIETVRGVGYRFVRRRHDVTA
jgi:two-component system phosphate regulon response regulator PhoB